jgi:hypothetical protein
MAFQRIFTREDFIDYCLRRLGHPVIEINVDDQQIEDRINDAINKFYEHSALGSYRTYRTITITQAMIDAASIDMATSFGNIDAEKILSIVRVLPINDSTSSVNFFDIKYQMKLNDMSDLTTGIGDLAYYEQMQQYLSTIDMKLTGHPQIQYNRYGQQLQIFGDLGGNGDLRVGDKILVEAIVELSDANTRIFDDPFMKEYATALIKYQWGQNLIKFEGMQLPGGVTLNGQRIMDEARQEIEKVEEKLYNEYNAPVAFFVG